MDQRIVQLLQDVQAPDTNRVKAATAALRKDYYQNPQSLIWLLMILVSHETSSMRQQAAVEALRLVPKHWTNLSNAQKPEIRQKLLESTLAEQTSLVRHSSARVIAAIACIDLEDGEWSDLPGVLAQACTSSQVGHRETGTYILFSLIEASGDGFADKLPSLLTLFSKTLQDQASQEVRTNTMLALSRIAMLIDPDADAKLLKQYQAQIPVMVQVLKKTIDDGDEEHSNQCFEVFQTLLGCESALLALHFKDLVQFMIDISLNKDIVDEARSQALSFIMQCVKYRKMKVQGINGMGEQLTLKSMEIAAELDDDDDDEEDITPARSALGLLDLLATSLPPRQVIVPLLKALPQFVNSDNPALRQAGILALGMCVEGAPDFIATQLGEIIPIVLRLLNDPDIRVRRAALKGAARLSDDLAEDMSKEHAQLIPAMLKNLDASMVQASSETEQKINAEIINASCMALDSFVAGMDEDTSTKYAGDLIPRLGQLLSHPDYKVKGSAAAAMGSLASAAEQGFLPYFEPTMQALSQYVTIKDSEEDLELRGTVCDAMGAMANAVGAVPFQPYVAPLMQASEEALHLGHPRLKETSYILWSTMAKVYEKDFTHYLPGVVAGLMACLEQEESEELQGEEAAELLGQEVVIGGKKIQVHDGTVEDLDGMEEDDDDSDDWDDMTAVTAVALEKEIAVEVIGDICSHTRENFIPYLEKAVEAAMTLVEHSYEGVRKAAISTLWRSYACLWALMEDNSGVKWTPGIPLQQQPSEELLKLGEVVATATMSIWGEEMDRDVVTDINRNIAATLRLCGPAILTHQNMMEQVTTILSALVTRSHPCQLDLGEEDMEEFGESSEYDWLVIDTALDAVIGLSAALGSTFGELWKLFEKPIMKLASSNETFERSTAIGVMAEVTQHMGASCTPYTETMLKMIIRRLSDEDSETRSNAAYAAGVLCMNSTNTAAYLPSYNQILGKLEPMLHTEVARSLDNAAGCVSRMIMAHPDKMPISDVLPVLVGLLPLKEDFEENKPIYQCIIGLYQAENGTVQQLTNELIPVFAQVLGGPDEQLDDDTRARLIEVVKYLGKQQPTLLRGHQNLMALI